MSYPDEIKANLDRADAALQAAQVCQENNINIDCTIDVFGIVTNGETWRFYKLTVTNEVYETLLHSISEQAFILGMLQRIFNDCEANLLGAIA